MPNSIKVGDILYKPIYNNDREVGLQTVIVDTITKYHFYISDLDTGVSISGRYDKETLESVNHKGFPTKLYLTEQEYYDKKLLNKIKSKLSKNFNILSNSYDLETLLKVLEVLGIDKDTL